MLPGNMDYFGYFLFFILGLVAIYFLIRSFVRVGAQKSRGEEGPGPSFMIFICAVAAAVIAVKLFDLDFKF